MKKLALISGVALLLFSCGPKKSESGPGQDSTQVKTVENKTETIEERPSPLKRTTGTIEGMKVVVGYGSPAVKNRQIWGSLVPYNEVWRTGANEATNIDFPKNVLIEGKPLAAGKYSFFTIPGEQEWTLIFNNVWDQWGAYDYDPAKDALRVTVTPVAAPQFAERLDYKVDPDGIAMVWEKLMVKFTVKPQ